MPMSSLPSVVSGWSALRWNAPDDRVIPEPRRHADSDEADVLGLGADIYLGDLCKPIEKHDQVSIRIRSQDNQAVVDQDIEGAAASIGQSTSNCDGHPRFASSRSPVRYKNLADGGSGPSR